MKKKLSCGLLALTMAFNSAPALLNGSLSPIGAVDVFAEGNETTVTLVEIGEKEYGTSIEDIETALSAVATIPSTTEGEDPVVAPTGAITGWDVAVKTSGEALSVSELADYLAPGEYTFTPKLATNYTIDANTATIDVTIGKATLTFEGSGGAVAEIEVEQGTELDAVETQLNTLVKGLVGTTHTASTVIEWTCPVATADTGYDGETIEDYTFTASLATVGAGEAAVDYNNYYKFGDGSANQVTVSVVAPKETFTVSGSVSLKAVTEVEPTSETEEEKELTLLDLSGKTVTFTPVAAEVEGGTTSTSYTGTIEYTPAVGEGTASAKYTLNGEVPEGSYNVAIDGFVLDTESKTVKVEAEVADETQQGTVTTATTATEITIDLVVTGAVETPPTGTPGAYTITFDSNEGSPVASMTTGTDGKLTALPTDPTKEGFVFQGWYLTEDFTGNEVTTETVFGAISTVYAKWNAIYTPSEDVKYTITFDADNGTEVTGLETGTDGKLTALPTEPTKADATANDITTKYTFNKWVDENGDEVTTDTVFTANTEVTAVWIATTDVSVSTGATATVTTTTDEVKVVISGSTAIASDATATIKITVADGSSAPSSIELASAAVSTIVADGGTLAVVVPTNDVIELDATGFDATDLTVESGNATWEITKESGSLASTIDLAVSVLTDNGDDTVQSAVEAVVAESGTSYNGLDNIKGLISFSHSGNLVTGSSAKGITVKIPTTITDTNVVYLYKLNTLGKIDINSRVDAKIITENGNKYLEAVMKSCSDYVMSTSLISAITTYVPSGSNSNSSSNSNSGSYSYAAYETSALRVNGSVIPELQGISVGEMINLDKITTFNGQEILGWYTDSSLTKEITNTSTFVVTSSVMSNGLFVKVAGSTTGSTGTTDSTTGNSGYTGSTTTTAPTTVPSTIAKLLGKLF